MADEVGEIVSGLGGGVFVRGGRRAHSADTHLGLPERKLIGERPFDPKRWEVFDRAI